MFSRVRAIKSLILGFTWAGAYGVSREIMPVDTSLGPNAWVIPFGVLCLTMMILLTDGLPAAERRERELNRKKVRQWLGDHPTNAERFKKRMQIIQKLANDRMKTAQYDKPYPIREHVLVPWNEMLAIWDLANLAESETPVED
jgi:hypothetical protein